jgi:hypothetical protein
MKRLTEIGLQTGADKAVDHLFTEVYDDIFSQYKSPRILEIGVHYGASIDMYLQYFENPYVVGMDIEQKIALDPRWRFVLGDQTNPTDLDKCVESEPFDIILDDGGHTMRQQQITFGHLFKHVKSGGYYILEDLHTSAYAEYIEAGTEYTSYEMIKELQAGETYFSNYIPRDVQVEIASRIDSITLWHRTPGISSQSVTSIIKVK